MQKTKNLTVTEAFEPIRGDLLDALSEQADHILEERMLRELELNGHSRHRSILARTAESLLNVKWPYTPISMRGIERKRILR